MLKKFTVSIKGGLERVDAAFAHQTSDQFLNELEGKPVDPKTVAAKVIRGREFAVKVFNVFDAQVEKAQIAAIKEAEKEIGKKRLND